MRVSLWAATRSCHRQDGIFDAPVDPLAALDRRGEAPGDLRRRYDLMRLETALGFDTDLIETLGA
jgi:hypothetical protein